MLLMKFVASSYLEAKLLGEMEEAFQEFLAQEVRRDKLDDEDEALTMQGGLDVDDYVEIPLRNFS